MIISFPPPASKVSTTPRLYLSSMSDPNTPRPPPRPIAPNSGAAGGDSHQIPPMSRHFSNSQASLDDSSTHPMPARKHKTTACDTCKLKKLKVWFSRFLSPFSLLFFSVGRVTYSRSILTLFPLPSVSWWSTMRPLCCQRHRLPNRRVKRYASKRCPGTPNRDAGRC